MSKQPTMAHEQRVVRVFVSSTFRDMHAERDELIKRTFPQLRKVCEKRGVTFSGVDLRWGVTEEQSRRGEVLPICLAEIQRCRPYFIGLLGERYGWVPDAIPRELIEREPWLKEHLHQSVTELEILHGVLNDPTIADRALFYFRDRAFIDSLPPDEQTSYLELPTKEEIQRVGQQEAERRTHERREKLAALKARIRTSGRPVPQNYPTPQALGERVLGDLTEIIERLYPIDDVPDPLDREALDHDAFAESRAKVYIGHQAYFDRLDQHARKERTCRELGNKNGLQRSLGNQALILADRGELDEAMRLHNEQERMCRELGNKEGLARSLIDQAQLLAEQMGQPDKAGPLADEAYRIATVHGLIPLAQQIKPILDALHSRALNDTRAEG